MKTLEGYPHDVYSVAISLDGKLLATGSGNVKLWTLPEGILLKTIDEYGLSGFLSIAISSDGTLLASGDDSQGKIKLWVLPEGEPNWCLFDSTLTEEGTKVREYRWMNSGTICGCNTVVVSTGTSFFADAICVCNTVKIGHKPKFKPESKFEKQHYWYPN